MGFTTRPKKHKKDHINLWDAEAEALIAILATRIAEIRKLKADRIILNLNYELLRKRKNVKNKNNYGPTPYQRAILNQKGY